MATTTLRRPTAPVRCVENARQRVVARCAKHAAVIAVIVGLSALTCIYANPYSLHRVAAVSYDAFGTRPNAAGLVPVAGQMIDFRLPRPTLAPATVSELRARFLTETEPPRCDIPGVVAFVRSHLNALDRALPPADTTDAETLLRQGMRWHCLCSDHALLLNEMLQACGLQSRVLWLEGHVAAEYFDEPAGRWIFLDAHMNVACRDADGQPLSAADLIWALERDETVAFVPLTTPDAHTQSWQYDADRTDIRLFYRNVLLNGECRALSGSTLQYPSRWTHLLRFGRAPQMLVLHTDYDAPATQYMESFQVRKSLLVAAAFLGAFYVLGAGRRTIRPTGRVAAFHLAASDGATPSRTR